MPCCWCPSPAVSGDPGLPGIAPAAAGLVQDKFGRQLRAVNTGFEKEGAFYLFSLRLVPIFPFLINLPMGLLPIGAWRYYLGIAAGHAARRQRPM